MYRSPGRRTREDFDYGAQKCGWCSTSNRTYHKVIMRQETHGLEVEKRSVSGDGKCYLVSTPYTVPISMVQKQ